MVKAWRIPERTFPAKISASEFYFKFRAAGAPAITVFYPARLRCRVPHLDSSDAYLAAWLPGIEGQGGADILFGDYKPTGKLLRTWPRVNSQSSAQHLAGNRPFLTALL
jgi:hypothetical protein